MLSILHEDAHLLALAKPAGIATQGPRGRWPTLDDAVRAYLRPDDPASAYTGTLHRLDRPVSGVVLWAKTPAAARNLSRQFERRQVRKEYWAAVEGTPPAPEGLWEDWLVRDDTGVGWVQRCAPGTPRAQPARTRWRIGAAADLPAGCAWLVLWPETGRMHQLRVQAAGRGWPVLGDRLYGSERDFAPDAIALHARALTVRHPIDGHLLTIEAPVPDAWAEAGITLEPPVSSR